MIQFAKKLGLIAASILACSSTVYSQKAYSLKSHKVSVDGTSTVHDWSSAVTKVQWSGSLTMEGNQVKAIQNVEVTIPVLSIKSEKGDVMDEKTYEAFNHEKNPNIVFKQTKATITGNDAKVFGILTMAGVSKPVALNASIKVAPDGSVRFLGSQFIYMTQYQMVPPKAVMGTIKVDDKVTIIFDIVVIPQ